MRMWLRVGLIWVGRVELQESLSYKVVLETQKLLYIVKLISSLSKTISSLNIKHN